MSTPSPADSVRLPYGRLHGRPAPLIALTLYCDHLRTDVDAYVDSGAYYSVFQADIAARLGLAFQMGIAVSTIGADGRPILVFLHRVGLRIAEFQLTATVGFSEELGIGFNLLGRHSVFNQLQFCFNDRDGELVVSPL